MFNSNLRSFQPGPLKLISFDSNVSNVRLEKPKTTDLVEIRKELDRIKSSYSKQDIHSQLPFALNNVPSSMDYLEVKEIEDLNLAVLKDIPSQVFKDKFEECLEESEYLNQSESLDRSIERETILKEFENTHKGHLENMAEEIKHLEHIAYTLESNFKTEKITLEDIDQQLEEESKPKSYDILSLLQTNKDLYAKIDSSFTKSKPKTVKVPTKKTPGKMIKPSVISKPKEFKRTFHTKSKI